MNEHRPQIAPKTDAPEPKIAAEHRRALQTFTLMRPQTLNAFDDDMCRLLASEIPAVARNPDIYIVALLSGSQRAFCAGGDVVALTNEARRDIAAARTNLRSEYELNWLLECFSKPTVSLIDGICMGSGVGLTAYNTHRVAGENYKWAMPEAKIGFFPDVGAANVLARLPWPIGLYLGLTGRSIARDDAQWLGLATHCISASRFDGILTKLQDAEPVDPILDGLNEMQQKGPVQKDAGPIRDHFSHSTLGEIIQSLAKADAAGSEWATRTLASLRQGSPLSLAITDRHIRAARALDIRETLIADNRIAARCLQNHDFHEGVRAALRDKDGRPLWRPARLEDVTPDLLDPYFAPLGDQDLVLASRSEMQAARV